MELTEIVSQDEKKKLITAGEPYAKFSPAIHDFVMHTNFAVTHSEPEQLLYDYSLEQNEKTLNIHTEEQNFQVFLNAMIHYGAKIEVFSAHDYPSKYSRH